ncbi:MAG TPA: hypothetical protein VGG01_24595 [Xanthobacteraceae bacterium]|jgi:hypothetical protein
MTYKKLLAAAFAALPACALPAAARAPAPLVPIAIVEDVKSATADVEFMDYVGAGQTIKLGPHDVLVLSYLRSCEHETIRGGSVRVGLMRSEVSEGQVARTKVACDGGKIELASAAAPTSAASAFRVQSADTQLTLFARSPMVQLPQDLAPGDRTLMIVRTDRRGERHTVRLANTAAAGGFVDLARQKVHLTRGASYEASVGSHKLAFAVDRKARSGAAPVVSRLLRFE